MTNNFDNRFIGLRGEKGRRKILIPTCSEFFLVSCLLYDIKLIFGMWTKQDI